MLYPLTPYKIELSTAPYLFSGKYKKYFFCARKLFHVKNNKYAIKKNKKYKYI